MNNYQSRWIVEQMVFDARQTSRGVQTWRFSREMAGVDARRSHSDIILNVLRNCFGVTLAEKTWRSSGSRMTAPRRSSAVTMPAVYSIVNRRRMLP